MKKTALAVAIPLAVVGLAVAGAWYTGSRVEQEVTRSLDEANAKLKQLAPDSAVSFSLLGIERGLFSSTARYQVSIPGEQGAAPRTLVFVDRLEHGPFPPSRLAKGQLAPVMAQSHFSLQQTPFTHPWFNATGGQVPLSGELTIGYDRRQSGELALAGFTYNARNEVLRLSPASLSYSVSADQNQVQLAGQLAELDLTAVEPESAKPVRVELRGLQLGAQKQEVLSGFALGPGSVKVQRVAVQTEGSPSVVLEDISADEALVRSAKGLDQTVSYRVGKLDVQGQNIGSLTLALSARNLDEKALKDLSATYNQIALANLQSDKPLEQQLSPVQQAELQAQALRLLDASPRLALDELSLRTAHGAASASFAVDLRKPDGNAVAAEDIARSVLAALKAEVKVDKALIGDVVALQAQGDASLDKVALKQQSDAMTDLFSGMALNSQWAHLEGNALVSSLSYANDKVNFNGRDMSVQEFLAFALGSTQGLGLGAAGADAGQAQEGLE